MAHASLIHRLTDGSSDSCIGSAASAYLFTPSAYLFTPCLLAYSERSQCKPWLHVTVRYALVELKNPLRGRLGGRLQEKTETPTTLSRSSLALFGRRARQNPQPLLPPRRPTVSVGVALTPAPPLGLTGWGGTASPVLSPAMEDDIYGGLASDDY